MAENSTLAERFKRDSHRICSLILNSDWEWIDIAIEVERMREVCETEAPEKLELFEAIYVSRFNRLWDQWRKSENEGEEWDLFEEDQED